MLAAGGGRSVGARGLGASGPARPHHHYLERWLVRVVAVIVRALFRCVSAGVLSCVLEESAAGARATTRSAAVAHPRSSSTNASSGASRPDQSCMPR